jgi:hypothetical protein
MFTGFIVTSFGDDVPATLSNQTGCGHVDSFYLLTDIAWDSLAS